MTKVPKDRMMESRSEQNNGGQSRSEQSNGGQSRGQGETDLVSTCVIPVQNIFVIYNNIIII